MRLLDIADKANLQHLDELGRGIAETAVLADDLPARFDPYPVRPAVQAAAASA